MQAKKPLSLNRNLELISQLGPALGLVLVYILFVAIGPPSFASLKNIEAIVRQTTIVGISALGMTLVIISGGIDLSIGSIVALVSVVIALCLQSGTDPLVACIAALATGMLCGSLNGLVITKLRLVPFIVTLGSLLIFRGVGKGLANEQKVDAPLNWLSELLAVLPPEHGWMLFPLGVWIMLALAGVMYVLIKHTKFGLHSVAVGSNEQTARLCGINVEMIKIAVYAISGLCAGLSGVMQFSRLTVGDPTVAAGLELDAIAAVVIGGGSLSGGQGSVAGTIVGALIMTVIRSGCTQIGIPNWVQEIVTGAIIVLAVFIDRLRANARQD